MVDVIPIERPTPLVTTAAEKQFFPSRSQQNRSASAKRTTETADKAAEGRSLAMLREEAADRERSHAQELHNARMSTLRAEHQTKISALTLDVEVQRMQLEVQRTQLAYWQAKLSCFHHKRLALLATNKIRAARPAEESDDDEADKDGDEKDDYASGEEFLDDDFSAGDQ